MRRRLPALLAVLGGIALTLGLSALYVRTQVLDRASFQARAVAALQTEPVRQIAAEQITDQIIDAGVSEVLTIRPVVISAISSFAGTPEFASALRVAAGNAHDVLVSGQEAVVIDVGSTLGAIKDQVASVSPRIADRIPTDLQPVLLELDQNGPVLGVVRSVGDWTAAATGLLVAAFLLFAGAVVFAPGRRRTQVATVGTAVAASGAIVVLVEAVARRVTIDQAARTIGDPSDRTHDALGAAFDAFFGDARAWGIATLMIGVVVALAATSAGALDPARGSTRLRGALRRIVVPPAGRAGRRVWGAAVAFLGLVVVFDLFGLAGTVALILGVLLVASGLAVALSTLDAAAARTPARLGVTRGVVLGAGVGLVVMASVIAALLVTTNGPSQPVADALPPTGCNGDKRLCDLRLDQVTFPGTHNSYSAADEPGWLFANQRLGIPRQLQDGIRLFLLDVHIGVRDGAHVRTDLEAEGEDINKVVRALGPSAVATAERVAGRLGRGNLRGARRLFLCHTLCELGAEDLDTTLRQYKAFLERDPGAVVVWFIEPYMQVQDLEASLRRTGLLPMLAELDRSAPLPTLGQLVRTGKRIVLFTELGGGAPGAPPWYLPGFSFVQDTPLGARNAAQLRCSSNRGDADSPLLQVNHWIDTFPPSPRANAAIGGTFLRDRLNRCAAVRGMNTSLVPVDFYDRSGVVGIAKERNEAAIAAAASRAATATATTPATPASAP